MTTTLQENWFKTAVGRAINPDRAFGLQCVDVADDYAMAIFPGKGWAETIGGVGGAREFAGRTNKYFRWVPNVVGDLKSIPARGDIVVFDGTPANPYGHVAVCISATAHAMTVIQQDGFLQTNAHVAVLPYWGPGTGGCTGWLRPLVTEAAPAANVRVTGPLGVKERAAASTTAAITRTFGGNLELTMKGYVTGPSVNGSAVWFVGISGKFFHASGFTSQSVAGLANLTPKPATTVPKITATQRFAGPSGAILRTTPDKNGAVSGTFKPGDILNFKGYVVATDPAGGKNPYWLVGISGHYVHTSAVVGASIGTLPNLTPKPAPAPLPKPIPAAPAPAPAPAPTPAAYTFPKRWDSVTKVVPADTVNFQRGNFPDRPVFAVIHQMDDPERHPTLAGTANWFQTPRPDAPSSAHLGAEGAELWAFVDTTDRAYAAGAVGNNYLNIEVPPNPTPATIETVKRFLREWKAKRGYELQLTRHMDVTGNNTACGTHIPLEAFSISAEPGADAGAVVTEAEVKVALSTFERLMLALRRKL